MNTYRTICISAILVLVSVFTAVLVYNIVPNEQAAETGEVMSPYAGEEKRAIAALPPEDVEGLRNGEGTPFGGMAKPAELNGYPGPRHVLDAADTGEIELSDAQRRQTEEIYEEMKSRAVELGRKIIELEKEIDHGFSGRSVTQSDLRENIEQSAELYGQLRFVHLRYHLAMMDILNEKQVSQYNEARGYASGGDPCDNIPAGHDPELWNKHNDCD